MMTPVMFPNLAVFAHLQKTLFQLSSTFSAVFSLALFSGFMQVVTSEQMCLQLRMYRK